MLLELHQNHWQKLHLFQKVFVFQMIRSSSLVSTLSFLAKRQSSFEAHLKFFFLQECQSCFPTFEIVLVPIRFVMIRNVGPRRKHLPRCCRWREAVWWTRCCHVYKGQRNKIKLSLCQSGWCGLFAKPLSVDTFTGNKTELVLIINKIETITRQCNWFGVADDEGNN